MEGAISADPNIPRLEIMPTFRNSRVQFEQPKHWVKGWGAQEARSFEDPSVKFAGTEQAWRGNDRRGRDREGAMSAPFE